MVRQGTRVVIWEFAITDKPGFGINLFKLWMDQARVLDTWVVLVFLYSDYPFALPAGGGVRDQLTAVARRHPAVMGVVDVVNMINNQCVHPHLCDRWSFVVDSHHPNEEVHGYIARELRRILALHDRHLWRGPNVTAVSYTSSPGAFLRVSETWKCSNAADHRACSAAAAIAPAGGVRTTSWMFDIPALPESEQLLKRVHVAVRTDDLEHRAPQPVSGPEVRPLLISCSGTYRDDFFWEE